MHYRLFKDDNDVRLYIFPAEKSLPSKEAIVDAVNGIWKRKDGKKFKAAVLYTGYRSGSYYKKISVTLESDKLGDVSQMIADMIHEKTLFLNHSVAYARIWYTDDASDNATLIDNVGIEPYRYFLRKMQVGNAFAYTTMNISPEFAVTSLFYKWREKYLPRGLDVWFCLKKLYARQSRTPVVQASVQARL